MFDITLMKKEMQDVLEKNILHFWMTQMVDEQHGGFYGRIDGQGVLHPETEKGAILNARILWSFSAAYRVLKEESGKRKEVIAKALATEGTQEREYLAMATIAKNYFIEHFIDKEYGGAFLISLCALDEPNSTPSGTIQAHLPPT